MIYKDHKYEDIDWDITDDINQTVYYQYIPWYKRFLNWIKASLYH